MLAIQDTTTVRAEADGRCIALHPVIAVDVIEGTVLGLVDAQFAARRRIRWLNGLDGARLLAAADAAQVTNDMTSQDFLSGTRRA